MDCNNGSYFHKKDTNSRLLSRALMEAKLQRKIKLRPTKDDLIQHNILYDSFINPSIIRVQDQLKRNQISDKLNAYLLTRPGRLDLLKSHIIPSQELSNNSSQSPCLESYIHNIVSNDQIDEQSFPNRGLQRCLTPPPIQNSMRRCSDVVCKIDRKKNNNTFSKYRTYNFHEFVPKSKNNNSTLSSSLADQPAHKTKKNYNDLIEQQTLYLQLEIMQRNHHLQNSCIYPTSNKNDLPLSPLVYNNSSSYSNFSNPDFSNSTPKSVDYNCDTAPSASCNKEFYLAPKERSNCDSGVDFFIPDSSRSSESCLKQDSNFTNNNEIFDDDYFRKLFEDSCSSSQEFDFIY